MEIFKKFIVSTSQKKVDPIPVLDWPDEWLEVDFKLYPRFNRRELKEYKPSNILEKVLMSRASERNIGFGNLDKDKLSKILRFSAGLNNYNQQVGASKRSYPSAGARYPVEVYIINLDIKGLDKGLYHYSVLTHELEELEMNDFREQVANFTGESWTAKAKAIIAMSVVPERVVGKYGARSFRYALFECGHLMQNILLLSKYYDVSSCPIGGFVDKDVNRLLRLDRTNEKAVYMAVLE